MTQKKLPALIGLAGAAGAGKDTLADYLCEIHGFYKYSLASPIKQALNAIFGFTDEQWADRTWKETVIDWIGKSPRQLAQTLGTEWGRTQVCTDLWLCVAEHRIARFPVGARVVIPDVRFANEAQLVRRLGGRIAQISRPHLPGITTHVSEQGLPMPLIDTHLTNASTPERLFAAAEVLLRIPR